MKTITIKCPHCGKERVLGWNNAKANIKCPHCNLKMKRDAKTEKHIKLCGLIGGLVITFVISLIVAIILQNQDPKYTMIGLILVALASNYLATFVAEFISFNVRPFTYEVVEKEDRKSQKKDK